MFLTMFYKKQNIAIMMPLTMLIAHPYMLVKRGLSTRYPLRRYPASCSCDAGKGTKLRKRNLLSCKHIAVVYSYFFCVIFSDYFCY